MRKGFVVLTLVGSFILPHVAVAEEQLAMDKTAVEPIVVKQPVQKEPPIPHDQLIKAVLDRLVNGTDEEAVEAGMALREVAERRDVLELVKALRIGISLEAQLSLIETMGALGDMQAAEVLRFELEQSSEIETQLAAAEALGQLRHDWSIPLLINAAVSGTNHVELRKRAISALGRIGSSRSLYALETGMKHFRGRDLQEAFRWALSVAKKEIDFSRVDTELLSGRKQKLMYFGTPYYFYYPAFNRERGRKPRLFVVAHDGTLRAEKLFDEWLPTAQRERVALLAPVFTDMRFPDYRRLNYRGERADKHLLNLVEHIVEQTGIESREMYMYGEGFGGEFVQRFSMAYPRRIARAAALAENFTMPDPAALWPKGIKRNVRASDVGVDLYSMLKTDLAIITRGRLDRSSPGRRFVQSLERYAESEGVVTRVALRSASSGGGQRGVEEYLFKEN